MGVTRNSAEENGTHAGAEMEQVSLSLSLHM